MRAVLLCQTTSLRVFQSAQEIIATLEHKSAEKESNIMFSHPPKELTAGKLKRKSALAQQAAANEHRTRQ